MQATNDSNKDLEDGELEDGELDDDDDDVQRQPVASLQRADTQDPPQLQGLCILHRIYFIFVVLQGWTFKMF